MDILSFTALKVVKNTKLRELIGYNLFGIAANLLATEEHLGQLKLKDIPHSWCIKKHAALILGHHIKEFYIHADKYTSLIKDMAGFEREFKRVFLREIVRVGEVRALRNHFRQLFGETTLAERCPTCELDGLDSEDIENSLKTEWGLRERLRKRQR